VNAEPVRVSDPETAINLFHSNRNTCFSTFICAYGIAICFSTITENGKVYAVGARFGILQDYRGTAIISTGNNVGNGISPGPAITLCLFAATADGNRFVYLHSGKLLALLCRN